MLRHEARHGGSLLNWVGKVFTVADVVRAYERALTGRRLEVYLPYSDSITTRVSAFVPATANRLIPLFERFARRRHARYLARIDADSGPCLEPGHGVAPLHEGSAADGTTEALCGTE